MVHDMKDLIMIVECTGSQYHFVKHKRNWVICIRYSTVCTTFLNHSDTCHQLWCESDLELFLRAMHWWSLRHLKKLRQLWMVSTRPPYLVNQSLWIGALSKDQESKLKLFAFSIVFSMSQKSIIWVEVTMAWSNNNVSL